MKLADLNRPAVITYEVADHRNGGSGLTMVEYRNPCRLAESVLFNVRPGDETLHLQWLLDVQARLAAAVVGLRGKIEG